MRSLVVYESMYGNTHQIAEAIGRGLSESGPVVVVPIEEAVAERVATADLLVVGGPTHVHGMSRPSTRRAAIGDAERPESGLHLDPAAEGEGVREWLDGLPRLDLPVAAFDTRMPGPAALTGRAARGISRHLRRAGGEELLPPESFLVSKENVLEDGELQRAIEWGAQVVRELARRRPVAGQERAAQ